MENEAKFVRGLCQKCHFIGHGETPEEKVLEFRAPTGKPKSRYSYEPGKSETNDHIVTIIHLCMKCVPKRLWPTEYKQSLLARSEEETPSESQEEAVVNELEELATVLHRNRCVGPHNSTGCSFNRETAWSGVSHREWLIQAEVTREKMSDLSIADIIRVLEAT